MPLIYKRGDCLQDSDIKRIIIHVCNNVGKFGAGFALAVANRHPVVKENYLKWFNRSLQFYDSGFNLGMIQPVTINENFKIINMIAQNGLISRSNPHPIDICRAPAVFRALAF